MHPNGQVVGQSFRIRNWQLLSPSLSGEPGPAENVPQKQAESRSDRDQDEIVVVGGSAAGLYTAATLARGGRRVRVLESKPGFEPDPRTLIVTNHFRNQLGASASASILNEIRRFELFTDGRSAQIALSKPDLIIERAKLIPALAREAQEAGAKVSFDSRAFSACRRIRAACTSKSSPRDAAKSCTPPAWWAPTVRPAAWLAPRVGRPSKPCLSCKPSCACPKIVRRTPRAFGSFPTTRHIFTG